MSKTPDKNQSLIDFLEDPVIDSVMKAGCIGEFEVPVTLTCPTCYDYPDETCSVCGGVVDYIYKVTVPWTVQKDIFKMMCKYKSISLQQKGNV